VGCHSSNLLQYYAVVYSPIRCIAFVGTGCVVSLSHILEEGDFLLQGPFLKISALYVVTIVCDYLGDS